MNCPVCGSVQLSSAITRCGVIIDRCPQCEGVWLDKGEIYSFTSTPTYLKHLINEALATSKESSRACPRSGERMVTIDLFGVSVEYSSAAQGFWLDRDELSGIPASDPARFRLEVVDSLGEKEPDEETPEQRLERHNLIRAGKLSPANLVYSSAFTIIGLYALLTLVLVVSSHFLGLPLKYVVMSGVIIAALQYMLGPAIMDVTLRWLYKFGWAGRDGIPGHLDSFIAGICAKQSIPYPRIGVIEDGSPQAFTYGQTPRTARIVISRGLVNLLTPEELEAVVAHEIGHITHWDMLVMTLAGIVPLILYSIYRTLIRSRGNGKGKAQAFVVAVICWLFYIISEYIVLWFSRIREYFADRFAGEVTANPNALSSALVKIGYGLAGKDPGNKQQEKEKSGTARSTSMEAIRPLGIFDHRGALALAVAGYASAGEAEVDKERLKGAMFWELWNPWAGFFELHSTHPLIAHRLEALDVLAVSKGQKPYLVFDRKQPECYWDEFLGDLLIKYLPVICLLVPAFLMSHLLKQDPLLLFALVSLCFGTGYLANICFSYPDKGLDREITVSGLLKKVKVSGVRGVPCSVKGKIIGRGIPGLIFSEDFVLKDDSGIIFLDYSQPIPFWDFLFGLLSARNMVGKEVTVRGWYRRAPVPYIEIRSITRDNGKTLKCHTYPAKIFLAALFICVGLLIMLILAL